jgi:hypothetical protein
MWSKVSDFVCNNRIVVFQNIPSARNHIKLHENELSHKYLIFVQGMCFSIGRGGYDYDGIFT